MIVGTAGHVDHGKTSLVKALTGVDTDRLPEEKRRGITLELGFAHLALPSGRVVGVVDVPGHERFVKAMAAGAGGIDVALLVVAADEGVMPQTREHVDICTLLGVRQGVLVVTKADLLPGLGEGWLELLEADLRSLAVGTVFKGAPLVTVSAKTGQGVEALKATLDDIAARLPERGALGPLFLPLDRAFTTKGFGCVVTGTLLSGKVSVEDDVALEPGGGTWRVRGLQVHGKPVAQVAAGQRVAVNLAGLETAQVSRGMVLARPGEVVPTRSLDVEVRLLVAAEAPLPKRSRLLVTLGTQQVEAVLQVLDTDGLRPGEQGFGQLRLGADVAALPGQRFILRGTRVLPGRGATLGGGRVLSVGAPRRRSGAREKLERLAQATLDARVVWLLAEAGYAGLTEAELFARASASPKELARALETSSSRALVLAVDKESRRFLSREVFDALLARAVARLDAFHREHPEADGQPREELRQKLGVPHEKTFARVVAALVEAKQAEVLGEVLRLPGRGRAYTEGAAALKLALLDRLERAGLEPPLLADLARAAGAPEARVEALLNALVAEHRLVRAGDLAFSARAVQALQEKVVAHLKAHGTLDTQAFKAMSGLSRKFLIPLAEYFDREKVTLRVGEARVLRKKDA